MVFLSLILKLAAVGQFIFFYPQGGQPGKRWMKKWLAPSVMAGLSVLVLLVDGKFNILSVVGSMLWIAAANGFAYGKDFTKDKTELKILFRGLCGASYGLANLLIAIGTGRWFLGVVALLVATVASIVFGVFNPFSKPGAGDQATINEDRCISASYAGPWAFLL